MLRRWGKRVGGGKEGRLKGTLIDKRNVHYQR